MSVYATADYHGCIDLFRQHQKFIKDDDIVYVIGDVIDRGPASLETLREVASDERFILLKGNHEDMLYRAIQDYQMGIMSNSFQDCINNGGGEMFEAICNMIPTAQDGWMHYLNSLPYEARYENKSCMSIYMSHSGADSYSTNDDKLWSRSHFFTFEDDTADVIVHGHTPIPLMVDRMSTFGAKRKVRAGAFWYCQDGKVCLDAGSVWTGISILLDLDTFEDILFNENGKINSIYLDD